MSAIRLLFRSTSSPPTGHNVSAVHRRLQVRQGLLDMKLCVNSIMSSAWNADTLRLIPAHLHLRILSYLHRPHQLLQHLSMSVSPQKTYSGTMAF